MYVQNGILFSDHTERKAYNPPKPCKDINNLIDEKAFFELLVKRLYKTYGQQSTYDIPGDSFDVYDDTGIIMVHTRTDTLYRSFLEGDSVEHIAAIVKF